MRSTEHGKSGAGNLAAMETNERDEIVRVTLTGWIDVKIKTRKGEASSEIKKKALARARAIVDRQCGAMDHLTRAAEDWSLTAPNRGDTSIRKKEK